MERVWRGAARGDAALREITQRLDGVAPAPFETSREEVARAYDDVAPSLSPTCAWRRAGDRLPPPAARGAAGSTSRRARDRWCAPWSGSASTPRRGGPRTPPRSSCPPSWPAWPEWRRSSSAPSPAGRAPAPGDAGRADVAGVQRIFKVGGAQAIVAMAYGTETVPRVDKVLGPGNLFVVLAKRARLRRRGHRPAPRPHGDPRPGGRIGRSGRGGRRPAGPGGARPPGHPAPADHLRGPGQSAQGAVERQLESLPTAPRPAPLGQGAGRWW